PHPRGFADSIPNDVWIYAEPSWFERYIPGSDLHSQLSQVNGSGVTITQVGIREDVDGAWVVAPTHIVVQVVSGWPVRAIQCIGVVNEQPINPPEQWKDAIVVESHFSQRAVRIQFFRENILPLPLRPIVPGFAI